MTKNLITVVTPTIGESCHRLGLLFREMRQYTRMPFQQIVSDDGTLSGSDVVNQRRVCEQYGVEWTENPGPTYGVSYNLNHAFSKVETPWVYLLEDGLRPSWHWLEVAVDFIHKVGERCFQGRPVGMAGFASLQDWMLRAAGAIPSSLPTMEWWRQNTACVPDFEAGWNDGGWTWPRLLPGLLAACDGPDSECWTDEPLVLKRMVLNGVDAAMALLDPRDRSQAVQKWYASDRWPERRTAYCGWYPGAFMLINMEAWRQVGRFRDGCTFFEAHLGTRMGRAGWLSLCVEGPPWLHCPSQGFRISGAQRGPRVHLDTDQVFLADFGHGYMDAANVLANAVTPLDVQQQINEELATLPLLDSGFEQEWS